MDANSHGDNSMDIVEESNNENDDNDEQDNDDEVVEIQAIMADEISNRVTIRGNALRQIYGMIVRNRRSRRPNLRHTSTGESSDSSDGPQPGTSSNAVPEQFDTELPTEHSYLGNMTHVAGVGYLEADKIYKMLIFVNHTIVFPGETLPMIIPDYMFDPAMFGDEGIVFGVIFPRILKTTHPDLYGVTCQIFEKRENPHNNIMIKCRVLQRFVIKKRYNANTNVFTDLLDPFQRFQRYQRKVYANVLILPEIILPDPLNSLMTGSMSRFRDISSLSGRLRRFEAATTVWPAFVYNQYRVDSIIERAKKLIASYKLDSIPTDMTFMTFWLCRNLIFNPAERIKAFVTNSVNMRMQIIEKSLDLKRFFCCARCNNQLADASMLFAMSKHGVQTNYCNPAGFIHETNTVYSIQPDAVYHSGAPSTEFSWFPGYSWQILLCRLCQIHVGWQFSAVKPNLVPKNFYALSSTNVTVAVPDNDDDDVVDHIRTDLDDDEDDDSVYSSDPPLNGLLVNED